MIRIILGISLGAGLGLAIGFLGRCSSGVCPLTSNPVITTIVGALLGLALVLGR